jgi:glycosyltransferase involved in cell wall biosynthesis
MKISVVIPALNEEKYLPKLLNSLSVQKTKFEYEIIVADGYSEDNTVKIAKKAGAKVVMERNRSAAWERTAGAKIASGNIIAFVDSDTIVPDDWVERIGCEFEKKEDVVMVYGCAYLLEESRLMNSIVVFSSTLFIFVLSLFGIHNTPGFNMAVRKEIYEKCGGFDTALVTGEDLDLAKKMSRFGRIKFVPSLVVGVSARRIKKWGLLKFVVFHLVNLFNFAFKGKTSKNYESVR